MQNTWPIDADAYDRTLVEQYRQALECARTAKALIENYAADAGIDLNPDARDGQVVGHALCEIHQPLIRIINAISVREADLKLLIAGRSPAAAA